ncbi:MAG: aconitate hydratase AcnA [Alphaproteobacteria bacterium]
MQGTNQGKNRTTLSVGQHKYTYCPLKPFYQQIKNLNRLPFSLKILLENVLRHENGVQITRDHVGFLADWLKNQTSQQEVPYFPARVLMQDFTGVPAIADLAAMRRAMQALGGNPTKVNPLVPVDLVIDHSVIVDRYGTPDAFQENVKLEYQRNAERYAFLRWGQQAFKNFRVVPPGTGICHQVNLEYLAQVVWHDKETQMVYPDTLVGTDSHTTMVNGLGVLGWGVGGIEAEAVMLGQPLSLLIPDVIGVKLEGSMPEGVTATDLVLTITHLLRKKGVVGKFVEFFGPGLQTLSLADRATIANMAPEYGATCGLFPIDGATLDYLKLTGRSPDSIALVEAYAKEQGFWYNPVAEDPIFTDVMPLRLETLAPSLAGPKRPQDQVLLKEAAPACKITLRQEKPQGIKEVTVPQAQGEPYFLADGHVVLAAITSCTNTSNPSVLVGAGLLARKAREKGLKSKPWVKTSFAPGSQVVTDYLDKAGLLKDLEAVGFHLVGYGCTTCIGNSGPLKPEIGKSIEENDLTVAAVLSGNRNFEGRIHPQIKLNYLASPPLVVAYALAGSMLVDFFEKPLGEDANGAPVFFKDIWPTQQEIHEVIQSCLSPKLFSARYADVFKGDALWQNMGEGSKGASLELYEWHQDSTYVKCPPYFEHVKAPLKPIQNITGARALALLGDSITTDHISPAGSIKPDSPAGLYLQGQGVKPADFNSYGSRRGNHEVMIRGTFANIRLRNEMLSDVLGGYTTYVPTQETLSIYEASQKYQADQTPLIIVAGKEYGTGSSRDWAAKGTKLLGVQAVIAESFERIHRSNLVGMGVLPFVFSKGYNRQNLELKGTELFHIKGLEDKLKPGMTVELSVQRETGETQDKIPLICRLDTEDEIAFFNQGGILLYVLEQLRSKA